MTGKKLLKEKVKTRMLENAARLWGAGSTDIESNFDPLVAMLIEGCVNEIEKIGNQIENTQVRVINRLAQLLIPDASTGYYPAHAIVHARPVDSTCMITQEAQFSFAKKISNITNQGLDVIKEICFSPVCPVNLTSASLKYIAFKDQIFENTSALQKRSFIVADAEKKLNYACLWLAVDQSDVGEDATDLHFYFDLKNIAAKNTFLQLLPVTKWSVNGEAVTTMTGLPIDENHKTQSPEDEFNHDKRIEWEVISAYNQHFISVAALPGKKNFNQKGPSLFPQELQSVFSQKDLQKLSGNNVWIKVEFPYAVADHLLTDLVCNINCFPAVNKKSNEFMFRLSQNLNVVPLISNENFFSVKAVTGTEGAEYISNPLNPQTNVVGTYTLRQGGIERFDTRSATEMINYLLDLLRDESAAFTILGNEFISSYLTQLNQLLTLLEQRTGSQGDNSEPTPYLLINPKKQGENIAVSFWTTDGESANNIRAGSQLELMEGGDVDSNSIMLMTPSTGGRNKLNDLERLRAFRYSLISRGRIVTKQDINMFCRLELGKEIEEVKVQKGFMVEEGTKNGFVQTTDVVLKISKSNQYSKVEWDEICNGLGKKLMSNSQGMTLIRVLANTI